MAKKELQTSDLIATERLPAERHPAAVYLASLRAGSLPGQRSALRQVAALFGADLQTLAWHKLRYQHVQWVRARLGDQYSTATVNKTLTALRRVLREAWLLGLMTENQYRRIRTVGNVKGESEELAGRLLTPGEVGALMAACANDPTAAGARDAAIIALGYGLGLRRVELSRLQRGDFDDVARELRIAGKGGKVRILPLDNGALDALLDWLVIRGDEPGPMWAAVNKGGGLGELGLNSRSVHVLFGKRAREAKVKGANFHDLRRSFVTALLDAGVDIATVAKLAGHADPRTTARYDRRTSEARRNALKVLHVPHVRRGLEI